MALKTGPIKRECFVEYKRWKHCCLSTLLGIGISAIILDWYNKYNNNVNLKRPGYCPSSKSRCQNITPIGQRPFDLVQ